MCRPKGSTELKEYSKVLGKTLADLARRDNRIVAVTAAMTGSLGLNGFFKEFPERSFDVGICEEHASVLCAAMATQGMKPYYAIYSTFLQRAYDEIIHDICCQNLPVTLCIDRAGISGSDGETHQGVFDLSYLTPLPNMTIAVPKDTEEFANMIKFSASFNSPLAIRYPRGGNNLFGDHKKIVDTSWEYLSKTGGKVTILASGERCISVSFKVKQMLEKDGIGVDIVNARFVKPLDIDLLDKITSDMIITAEDNMLIGGFGGYVSEYFSDKEKKVKNFAYEDKFIPQGGISSLMEDYGVSAEAMAEYIKENL